MRKNNSIRSVWLLTQPMHALQIIMSLSSCRLKTRKHTTFQLCSQTLIDTPAGYRSLRYIVLYILISAVLYFAFFQVKFIDYFISGLFDAWNSELNEPENICSLIPPTPLPPLPSAFCPIPTLMDYLKSNYEYWKSHCPDSPSYSEEENDAVSHQSYTSYI